MGANPTQAYAVSLFLLGFVVLSAAVLAKGSMVLVLVAIAFIAASFVLFRRAKPWENRE